MFETDLQDKLKRIFNFKKTSFDDPSASAEQECLFIEIVVATVTVKDKTAIARVTGKLKAFANHDKLPYGYFAKHISAAARTDAEAFFFHDIEENAGRYGNIAERSLSFVYFFQGQYNPEVGTMNEFEVIDG